ncbi:MAG TPA: beta-ketoacyl synthase N-terminal-like domain-containing protein, partial [Pseudonocardiaceae bacterium]
MRDQHRIAIIGIGLRYPDATSPRELWENVLSGRRPFRAIPAGHAGFSAVDRINRLALDVVSDAVADAGFRDGLPRAATSVVLGNSGGVCHAALAGGICDHFDLGGGGFTVGTGDSPSLLPVIAATAALADQDVDVAIAGGIGPSVADGERFDGSGLLVLMREADAIAGSRRIYGTITGCGMSSGSHDNVDGHQSALARAYRRAGYGIDTVSYRETGIAGLIKAVLAVHNQVIPPAADRHEPALWPVDRPIRAGVSAQGAGGINMHVAIEEPPGRQSRWGLAKRPIALAAGRQDAEVLLLDAPDVAALRDKVAGLAARAPRL